MPLEGNTSRRQFEKAIRTPGRRRLGVRAKAWDGRGDVSCRHQAADANLGAITYYFGSKDALVAEAVGGAIEALLAPALQALQDEARDPVGRLLGAVTQLQQAYEQSDRGRSCLLGGPDPEPTASGVATAREPDARRDPFHLVEADGRAEDARIPSRLGATRADGGAAPRGRQGVVLQTAIDAGGPNHTSMADQFAQLLLASRADTH